MSKPDEWHHTCEDWRTCARCQSEDAAERAAIQTDGQPASAYQQALALILESRRAGQRRLALG